MVYGKLKRSDSKLYETQTQAAQEVLTKLKEKSEFCILIGQPQCGKSGTNAAIIREVMYNERWQSLNTEYVFIISGMLDNELKDQTQEEIVKDTGFLEMRDYVLFNWQLRRLKAIKKIIDSGEDLIKNKIAPHEVELLEKLSKNCIIIVDESHWGAETTMVVETFLNEVVGVSLRYDAASRRHMRKKKIKLVTVSATPNTEIACEMAAKLFSENVELKERVLIPVTNEYFGIVDMLNENKLHQMPTVTGMASIIRQTKTEIKEPFNILIRAPKGKKSKNDVKFLRERLVKMGIVVHDYDYTTRYKGDDINKRFLNVRPKRHTAIFVKGFLRAGKQLNTRYVRLAFDYVGKNVDTATQSFPGRFCGYPNELKGLYKNRDIDIYTNLEAITAQAMWIRNDYEESVIAAPTSYFSMVKSRSEFPLLRSGIYRINLKKFPELREKLSYLPPLNAPEKTGDNLLSKAEQQYNKTALEQNRIRVNASKELKIEVFKALWKNGFESANENDKAWYNAMKVMGEYNNIKSSNDVLWQENFSQWVREQEDDFTPTKHQINSFYNGRKWIFGSLFKEGTKEKQNETYFAKNGAQFRGDVAVPEKLRKPGLVFVTLQFNPNDNYLKVPIKKGGKPIRGVYKYYRNYIEVAIGYSASTNPAEFRFKSSRIPAYKKGNGLIIALNPSMPFLNGIKTLKRNKKKVGEKTFGKLKSKPLHLSR
jgi:hypothetical protein